MSAATTAFGLRFFTELLRLTASTFSLSHADISRLERMDREEVLGFLASRQELDWAARLDSTSPEQLAAEVVRESQARDHHRARTAVKCELLGRLFAALLPWP